MDRFLRALAKMFFAAGLVAMSAGAALAQADAGPKPAQKDAAKTKYSVHQTFDLGGHIAEHSGSNAVYDTLVNLHSGPRILNHTLDAHALEGAKRTFFDTFETASSGYGGDPNSFSTLRFSKGKLYDFQGFFRRDRQYFDYDPFGNPLVPANLTTTTGYTFPQVLHAPHLFNTVRQMTDLNVTLLPLSKVSIRAGFTHSINQGPTFSSVHYGIEALLSQQWRYSTDTWTGAVDWRPLKSTAVSFEEYLTHYKWSAYWQLAGLNLNLSDGTPVSLGFDNVTVPNCGNKQPPVSYVPGPTAVANATCNGYLQYTRSDPMHITFPTEVLHFVTGNPDKVQVTGSIRYTGATMNMPLYSEYFNGLQTRGTLRAATFTGNSSAKRINAGADFGLVWNVSPRFVLSDQYDFQNWRQPGTGNLIETDQLGTSMLNAPGAAQDPVENPTYNFLGQKEQTNTLIAEFLAGTRASVSVGYRFRVRTLGLTWTEEPDSYTYDDHQNSALFGVRLQPMNAWRVNGNVEVGWANNAYVQLDPRQWQRYAVRTQLRTNEWSNLTASYIDFERRDNAANVGFAAHDRAFNAAATLAKSSRFGMDVSYGYTNVYSRINECFADAVRPAGVTPMPAGFACENVSSTSNPPGYFGYGFFDSPTQFGAITFNISPVKQLRADLGYRMSAVNGNTQLLNPRAVPGSLQSQYQTPFATVIWNAKKNWGLRGDWNYYSLGEGSPIGPTLPRSFRGNVYTLAVHNEF